MPPNKEREVQEKMLDIKSEGQPLIADMKGSQGLSFFAILTVNYNGRNLF